MIKDSSSNMKGLVKKETNIPLMNQIRYSALALVISKIKVGTTVKPIWSRPQFFIKTWSYMSGELRECSNFKNFFVKNCKNLGFLGQSGL